MRHSVRLSLAVLALAAVCGRAQDLAADVGASAAAAAKDAASRDRVRHGGSTVDTAEAQTPQTVEQRLAALEIAQQEMMRSLVLLSQRVAAAERSGSGGGNGSYDLRRLQMEVQNLRGQLTGHITGHSFR